MQGQGENFFWTGINADDDVRTLSPGEYYTAEFLRFYNGGTANTSKALASTNGNALVDSGQVLAEGFNIPIASCQWLSENSIIIFYWNDNSSHSIWAFSFTTNSWTLILEDPVLNFKLTHKFWRNPFVIGTDILRWTDGYFDSFLWDGGIPRYNDAREISLSKMIAYSNGDPGGYTGPITPQLLNAAKAPPFEAPVCTYVDDSSVPSNSLYQHQYKFQVQFFYDLNQSSPWGIMSEVPVPQGSEFVSGAQDKTYLNNRIEVDIPTGPENVKGIRVAVSVDGGPFGVFTELDKSILSIPDDSTYTVNYSGNESITPVTDNVNQYQDFPQCPYTQALLPDNIVSYANYYDGFDQVDARVLMTARITELIGTGSPPDQIANRLMPRLATSVATGVGFTLQIVSVMVSGQPYIPGDLFVIGFRKVDGGAWYFYEYTVQASDITGGTDALKHLAVMTAVANYLTAQGLAGVTVDTSVGVGPRINIYSNQNIQFYSAKVLRHNHATPTVKTGTQVVTGLRYLDDDGRPSTVYTGEDFILDVPFPADEDTSGFTDPNNPYSVKIRMTVTSDPPLSARYWQPMIKKSGTINSWIDRSIIRIAYDSASNAQVKIDLENSYQQANFGAMFSHTPQVGDNCRFKTKGPINAQTPNTYHEKTDQTVTMVIRKYDPAGGINGSEAIWVDAFDFTDLIGVTGNDSSLGALLEIFSTASETENGIWEDVGEIYDIINPHTVNAYHGGNTQDQTSVLPAIVDMNYYNAWLRIRPMGTGLSGAYLNYQCYVVEDMNYSDYYLSSQRNGGGIGIEDVNSIRKHLTTNVIHTFPFLENTNLNGTSTADTLKAKQLSSTYGPVNGMVVRGETLKVFQDTKVTSIYLLNAVARQGEDSQLFSASPEVFGSVNPHNETYGCVHPGTIQVDGFSIFFYDYNSGCVVQDTSGGLIPITKGDFKYNTVIQSLTYGIRQAFSIYDVHAYLDKENDEYRLVVSSDTDESQSSQGIASQETHVFNMVERRWVRRDPIACAIGQHLNTGLMTFDFIFGQGWIETAGQGVPNYFGVTYNPQVIFYTTENPLVMKQFETIGVRSNLMPVSIDFTNTDPSGFGQTTNINEDWFETLIGVFWADIPMNINTPNFATQDEARLDGDPMVSKNLQITIEMSGESFSVIFDVKTTFFVIPTGM